MDLSVLQGVMVVVGPILFAVGLLWAMSHNRTSKAQKARTEAATRRLQEEQDRIDAERDAQP